MNICLTLPSRTAVRSATFFGEEIAAVDGLHTRIFLFDTCGTCIESVNSLRCYSLLRYDPVSNGFVARCDTCGNRVFYLNCFFAEIGTASLGSLACEGPLYDVTMYDGRLYATFEDRVVAYTRDGSPLCTVVRPRPSAVAERRHYIRSGDESLTHIVRDGQSYIVHSSDGCGAGLVVPRGLTLRNPALTGRPTSTARSPAATSIHISCRSCPTACSPPRTCRCAALWTISRATVAIRRRLC